MISVKKDRTIKIWNLNDLTLFKEFKILERRDSEFDVPWPTCSTVANSKILARLNIDGDTMRINKNSLPNDDLKDIRGAVKLGFELNTKLDYL